MARSVFIVHAYPQTISLQLDDHWWHIPSEEPVEIESEFYAQKLIDIYGPVYGIVEVPTEKTRTGISFDPDAAIAHAKERRTQIEDVLLNNYLREQQDNRIRFSMTPLPPSGRVAEIVADRKLDLSRDYNINITGHHSAPVDTEKEKLVAENIALRSQLAVNSSSLDAIMARISQLESAGKVTGPPVIIPVPKVQVK